MKCEGLLLKLHIEGENQEEYVSIVSKFLISIDLTCMKHIKNYIHFKKLALQFYKVDEDFLS